MPRGIILTGTDLTSFGAIGVDFQQAIIDGDITVPQTTVRRMIMPDQDIDAQLDDLDTYFEANGYPKIEAADRQTIKGIRQAVLSNPGIVERQDKWLADQEANRAAQLQADEAGAQVTEPAPEEPAA